jgi:hypothetical protein
MSIKLSQLVTEVEHGLSNAYIPTKLSDEIKILIQNATNLHEELYSYKNLGKFAPEQKLNDFHVKLSNIFTELDKTINIDEIYNVKQYVFNKIVGFKYGEYTSLLVALTNKYNTKTLYSDIYKITINSTELYDFVLEYMSKGAAQAFMSSIINIDDSAERILKRMANMPQCGC